MAIPPVPPGGGRSSWSQDQPPPTIGNSPPNQSNRRRWILLCGVLGVVVALAAGLLVWKFDPGGDGSQSADGDIDRTVGVLREKDPVCDEWIAVSNELALREEAWAASNRALPSTAWSPEQRQIFNDVSEAMSEAADQYEAILPTAKNVVVKELVAQTIVYLRSFVERVPNYVEKDSLIAGVAGNFGTAVTYMCTVAPLLPALDDAESASYSAASEPTDLAPFMNGQDSVCTTILEILDRQSSQLRGWAAHDATIPSTQWTPRQRALNNAAREVIARDGKDIRAIAEYAESAILADLLVARADYMQVFADMIPTYTPDDALVWTTVTSLGGGLSAACKAEL